MKNELQFRLLKVRGKILKALSEGKKISPILIQEIIHALETGQKEIDWFADTFLYEHE